MSVPATAGQTGVRLACGCKGMVTTIVRDLAVEDWRCLACRRPGRPTGHRVTLGVDGALPPGWRDPPLCAHLLARCPVCRLEGQAATG